MHQMHQIDIKCHENINTQYSATYSLNIQHIFNTYSTVTWKKLDKLDAETKLGIMVDTGSKDNTQY